MSTIQAWLSLPPLFRRFGLGLLVAIVGVVVSLAPFGRQWEEDLGLTWLFRIRGPVAPPGEVVVVSIDSESSERLGLPGNPRKWPRDLHARLLDRLVEQGASIVAFDVLFQEHRDSARDQIFAESARRAGNVILLEFLKKDIVTMETGSAGDAREIVIEQRIPPVPALADAVLGLAPFALPRVPIKVSQVWLFKPEAGGAATLPMVAFHAHRLESYDEVLELLRQLDPGAYAQILRQLGKSEPRTRVDEQVGMLRRLLLVKPLLKPLLLRRIDEMNRAGGPSNRHLSVLIDALGGVDSIYLNYYGPPRTINTYSYHELLTGELDQDLAGRIRRCRSACAAWATRWLLYPFYLAKRARYRWG